MKVSFIYTGKLPETFPRLQGLLADLKTVLVPVQIPENLKEADAQETEAFLSNLESSGRAVLSVPRKTAVPEALWFLSGYGAGRNIADFFYLFNPGKMPVPRLPAEAPEGSSFEELSAYLTANIPRWRVEESRQSARKGLIEAGCALSETAMAEQIVQGNEHFLDLYLTAGFSGSAESFKGIPVLTLAVRKGHEAIARKLIEAGADINTPAPDTGNTPLMDAVLTEDRDLAAAFIEEGALIDVQNKNGQTALILAVGKANQELADLLLGAGADTEITDSLGMSALKYAELFKYGQLIPLLSNS